MDNLFVGNQEREFVVWVDPNDFLAKWNLNKIGTFFSIPPSESDDYLMFIPNPKFTRFHQSFPRQYVEKLFSRVQSRIAQAKPL